MFYSNTLLSGFPNHIILNNRITIVSKRMGIDLENLPYQKIFCWLLHKKVFKKKAIDSWPSKDYSRDVRVGSVLGNLFILICYLIEQRRLSSKLAKSYLKN